MKHLGHLIALMHKTVYLDETNMPRDVSLGTCPLYSPVFDEGERERERSLSYSQCLFRSIRRQKKEKYECYRRLPDVD